MNFGDRIINLREERDMKQNELSAKLNINRSVLNRIELSTRPIRDTELIQIAKFFNISTDYLLGLTNDRTATHTSTATDTMTLTEAEREHITMLRALSPEARRRVERNLKGEYEDSIDSQIQEATVCC